MAILKLVADNDELPSIAPQLLEIDALLDACNSSLDDKRFTYLSISEILYNDPNYNREGYEFILKYLNTFENTSNLEDFYPVEANAELAIRVAINTPGIYTFDTIRNLKAIQYLFAKQHLYSQIIDLFIGGDFSKYVRFCEENSEFMKEKGFDLHSTFTKMRFIALCKVFEKNLGSKLSFQTLAEAIDVPVNKIENWIVDLVQEELALVMIDQGSQSVVARFVPCIFS